MIPKLTVEELNAQYLGKTVRVYRNLRQKCWSVQDISTRRVICHTDTVYLCDVVPRVSEKGRARVRKERRKNVHAYLVGKICKWTRNDTGFLGDITYNPYKNRTFMLNNKPFVIVDLVYMSPEGGVFAHDY